LRSYIKQDQCKILVMIVADKTNIEFQDRLFGKFRIGFKLPKAKLYWNGSKNQRNIIICDGKSIARPHNLMERVELGIALEHGPRT
jgi:hypothetical protein